MGRFMTLRHLIIFIKVYENLSFTKAGKQLYMAQPAVSLAIKEIEEYYKIKLFDRIGRNIYPTDNAKNMYNYAIHIVKLFSQMEEEIQHWEEKGEIKIGGTLTISSYIFPIIIQQLKEKYPALKIKLYVNNYIELEKYIIENKIDIALIETDIHNENIIKVPFMKDHMVTFVNINHPLLSKNEITLTDLSHYPYYLREAGSSVTKIISSIFALYQIPIFIGMESTSNDAIIKNVEAGYGIGTLSYILIKEELEKHKIKEIKVKELNINRNYHIIYHKNKYISKTSRDFFKICMDFGKNYNH